MSGRFGKELVFPATRADSTTYGLRGQFNETALTLFRLWSPESGMALAQSGGRWTADCERVEHPDAGVGEGDPEHRRSPDRVAAGGGGEAQNAGENRHYLNKFAPQECGAAVTVASAGCVDSMSAAMASPERAHRAPISPVEP